MTPSRRSLLRTAALAAFAGGLPAPSPPLRVTGLAAFLGVLSPELRAGASVELQHVRGRSLVLLGGQILGVVERPATNASHALVESVDRGPDGRLRVLVRVA